MSTNKNIQTTDKEKQLANIIIGLTSLLRSKIVVFHADGEQSVVIQAQIERAQAAASTVLEA